MKRSTNVLGVVVLICLVACLTGAQPTRSSGANHDGPMPGGSLDSQWNRALAEMFANFDKIDSDLERIRAQHPDLAAALALSILYSGRAALGELPGRDGRPRFEPCPNWSDWKPGGRCFGEFITVIPDLTDTIPLIIRCDDLESKLNGIWQQIAASSDPTQIQALKEEAVSVERQRIEAGCPGNQCEKLQEELEDINDRLSDPNVSTNEKIDLVERKTRIITELLPFWNC